MIQVIAAVTLSIVGIILFLPLILTPNWLLWLDRPWILWLDKDGWVLPIIPDPWKSFKQWSTKACLIKTLTRQHNWWMRYHDEIYQVSNGHLVQVYPENLVEQEFFSRKN